MAEQRSVTQTELHDYSTQVAAQLGYPLNTAQLDLLRIAAGRLSGWTDPRAAYREMAEATEELLRVPAPTEGAQGEIPVAIEWRDRRRMGVDPFGGAQS